ncbi:hypothetical protein EYF80_029857 [Liparis tanakae]|uniref:Uncharacterized protein n=1 Tax=Liparis tanakae TaxID=230148 RepID=A0A4Z2H2S7_9TELE|nr:hypothetical protein EYF80_029857 [Liparis tanakae]
MNTGTRWECWRSNEVKGGQRRSKEVKGGQRRPLFDGRTPQVTSPEELQVPDALQEDLPPELQSAEERPEAAGSAPPLPELPVRVERAKKKTLQAAGPQQRHGTLRKPEDRTTLRLIECVVTLMIPSGCSRPSDRSVVSASPLVGTHSSMPSSSWKLRLSEDCCGRPALSMNTSLEGSAFLT